MNVPPKPFRTETLKGLTLTDSDLNGHSSPRIPDPDPAEVFPFALDPFQLEAIAALGDNCSVVVCAPTGSGKTLVGEYAIYRALAQGQRVFYTTPLKALSNQKYRDFCQQFGSEQVGLLTGDISINRDAAAVVMTTEIFRNMLYGTPIGEVGTSLEGVQAVILDECHYMNDQQRGTVWEESIIYCPAPIQLIALSATIANSDQLAEWMSHVHGPTRLIDSDHRPVPLQFHFASNKGIFPLLEPGGNGKMVCNRRLRTKGIPGNRSRRPRPPELAMVVDRLRQREMLPAIYFIFSRKGCDAAVQQMGSLNLISPEEQDRLWPQIESFCTQAPEAIRHDQLDALRRGIAAHHAGHLPAWKGLVEALFQQGLVKVVFATETLAAGINMPARTTVIASLSKRTDSGHRLLTASEFMQMSGRAGRRGMDTIGYVVAAQSPFEGAAEAAQLATSGADPLVSQFTPSYGMVLNLLQKHSLATARELVNRSFGQYLLSLQQVPLQQEIIDLQKELQELDQLLGSLSEADIQSLEKLQDRHREERRIVRILQKQLKEEGDPTLTLLGQRHIQEQEEKMLAVDRQIRQHPVFLAGGKKVVKLQERRQKLQRRLKTRNQEAGPIQELRWQQFLALVEVLQDFGYLQEGHQPTPEGEVVAALRGDNELWLALALLSGELTQLTPPQLAGAIAALISEAPRSGSHSRLRLSDPPAEALNSLRGLRRQLFRAQAQRQVYHLPIWMEPSIAGVVEHWAYGADWETLESSTTLDPGDLVRLMRRTLDVLCQIPRAPHLAPDIKSAAREVQQMMDRFPISELM